MTGVKVLAIAWKDLRSTARNVPALVMMLVAPLALAALLGFAFGGGGGFDIAATKVVVANLDKGGAEAGQNAGAAIQSVLTSKDLADVLETTHRELRGRRPARPSTTARRRWPSSSRRTSAPSSSAATRRRTSQVELYENPTSEIGGSIVEGVVGQVLADFNGARAAAAGAVALRSTRRRPAGRPGRRGAPPRRSATPAASRPACRSASARPRSARPRTEVSVTGSILSGMMIFFMFFGAANVARTILTEDRDGTMPRLFTTPTRHGTIIGGKFVAVFVTVLAAGGGAARRRPPDLRHPLGPHRRRSSCSRWSPPAWPAASPCSSSRSPRRRRRRAPSAPASTWSSPCSAATSPAPRRPAARTPWSRSSRPTAGCIQGWDTAMRGGGAGGHPLAGARAARVRRRVLLLRRAAA